MNTIKNNIYKNSEGAFLLAAQTGNFYVCDFWECDKNGNVKDIEENPCPVPKYTNDLVHIGTSKEIYDYPEFELNF